MGRDSAEAYTGAVTPTWYYADEVVTRSGTIQMEDGVAKKSKLRVVEIPDQSYQPSVKELNAVIRLPGTFDDAVKALVRPVRVRRIPITEWRNRK